MNSTKLLKHYSSLLKTNPLFRSDCCLRRISSNRSLPSTSRESHLRSVQNLVIDLSFDDKMSSQECQRLAREIYAIHCINNSLKGSETPFDISLCNQLSANSLTVHYLRQYLPQINDTNDSHSHNFHVYNKSYLEVFDTKRLLYLTPDTHQLVTYDTNDIYIIGGIVCKYCLKSKPKPLTSGKAVGEGVRFGKFPIEHLISDRIRHELVLFLPQVFGILSAVKETQNWEIAVRKHLPFWKLKQYKQLIPQKIPLLKLWLKLFYCKT